MRLFILFLTLALTFSVQAEQSVKFKVQQNNKLHDKSEQLKALKKQSRESLDDIVWFYQVESEISQDLDQDGYYQNLSLTMDLDTQFVSQDVFVDILLFNSVGEVELSYSSDIFNLNGDSELDAQTFDFQFFESFPTDYYQIQIEVYDAYNLELRAVANETNMVALLDLPLEGSTFDQDNSISVYSTELVYKKDADNDGYFESFALEIDVDTLFGSQTLVADIIIDNEVVFSSAPFTIHSDSTADEQRFDIYLASGYASNLYDIEVVIKDAELGIELYDLTSVNWINLANISLESEEYVQTYDVIEVEHSSGSLAFLLLGLFGAVIYRR